MASCDTGVYAIVCLCSNKVYIGSAAKGFKVRWDSHRRCLRGNRHHSIHLQRAWNRYGESQFEFKVLRRCKPSLCVKWEQKLIVEYNSADPKFGYNRSPTAGSILGMKFSDATRKRMADRMRNVPMPDPVKDKIRQALRGKKKSPEHRKNIWKNRQGWQHSEESKGKTSATLKALVASGVRLGPPAGWTHTDAAKRKMSKVQKGKPKSPEHRAKIAAALRGRTFSDEHRAHISQSKRSKQNGRK